MHFEFSDLGYNLHTVIYNWYNDICFICHRSQKTSALKKDIGYNLHTVIYNWYNNICFICHRSQKTSALQKDSGLHASNCGMSLRGLSSGQVLGYSTTPRTIQQLKANLSVQHTSFICQQFHRVNEVSPLGVNISNI